jgi:hypothetical protein
MNMKPTGKSLVIALLLVAVCLQGKNFAYSQAGADSAYQPVAGSVPKGLRVFSTGHSFHFAGYSLPGLLQEIARSAGIKDHVIAGTSVIFGSKVIQHWQNVNNNMAKAGLEAGTIDVLTTTPIYLPDDGIEKFAQLGFEHNPNFRLTVQEFWLPFDSYNPHYDDPPNGSHYPKAGVDHNAATVEKLRVEYGKYFTEMDALVTSLNQKFGKQVIFVVPVGQAVIALREKIIAGQAPGLRQQSDLFSDMLGHPKPPLQALIGYCHYAVIYRKSPVGLPVPSVLKKCSIPANEVEAYNRLVQELAWKAVIEHPLSGVTAN